ncbi:unnamed protein product, partial [Heterotrigona itama]
GGYCARSALSTPRLLLSRSPAAPPGQKVSFAEPAKFSNGFRRIGRCCAIKELAGTKQNAMQNTTFQVVFYGNIGIPKTSRRGGTRKVASLTRDSLRSDYIGFATLPEQVHRKSVKRGFEFTLMVLGESGLGKSTLINSLFLGDLYKDRRILDAAGFGDAVNCEDTWKACSAYIDEQFRQYFTDESGLNRKNIQDNRVHCCLYFIPPYGHGLRQIDLEVLKRLHRKVNVVPVIAKADTLTTYEVKMLKDRILADIEEHEIQIYQFPDCDSDEDEEFKQQDKELKACIPFAVVGSSTVLEVAGKKDNADIHAHARSERRDAGCALREFPGTMHFTDFTASHSGTEVFTH